MHLLGIKGLTHTVSHDIPLLWAGADREGSWGLICVRIYNTDCFQYWYLCAFPILFPAASLTAQILQQCSSFHLSPAPKHMPHPAALPLTCSWIHALVHRQGTTSLTRTLYQDGSAPDPPVHSSHRARARNIHLTRAHSCWKALRTSFKLLNFGMKRKPVLILPAEESLTSLAIPPSQLTAPCPPPSLHASRTTLFSVPLASACLPAYLQYSSPPPVHLAGIFQLLLP